MTTMNVIKIDATRQHGTALQSKDGSIWVSVAPKPWDVATWLWWWLAPSDKKVWLILNTSRGQRVRTRAIRISHRLVKVNHTIKAENA